MPARLLAFLLISSLLAGCQAAPPAPLRVSVLGDVLLARLGAPNATGQAAGQGAMGPALDSAATGLPALLGADSSVAVLACSAFRLGTLGRNCGCSHDFETLCQRLAFYKTLFPKRAVLVYVYWGYEHASVSMATQRQQAHTLIDCGAAAVVGIHPHALQPVEYYRGRPILYGLGHFLFAQYGPDASLALQADFDLRAGRVVATYLRPLQWQHARPIPANAHNSAILAARLLRGSPAVQLVPDAAGGWQLLPVRPATTTDSLPGYFARQVAIAGPAGPAVARLRYLPHARQHQVWVPNAHGSTSVVTFRYALYAFGAGDADNDGYPDLLIGPIKPTRFDSAWHRRLFVYSLDSTGHLQPRWRGSRLVYPLLCFRTQRAGSRTFVRTIEQSPDGRYCVGYYHWQGFGLVLDRFVARRLTRDAAYRCFILS